MPSLSPLRQRGRDFRSRREGGASRRRAGADALPGVAITRLAGLRVVALDETRNWGETEASFSSARMQKS